MAFVMGVKINNSINNEVIIYGRTFNKRRKLHYMWWKGNI